MNNILKIYEVPALHAVIYGKAIVPSYFIAAKKSKSGMTLYGQFDRTKFDPRHKLYVKGLHINRDAGTGYFMYEEDYCSYILEIKYDMYTGRISTKNIVIQDGMITHSMLHNSDSEIKTPWGKIGVSSGFLQNPKYRQLIGEFLRNRYIGDEVSYKALYHNTIMVYDGEVYINGALPRLLGKIARDAESSMANGGMVELEGWARASLEKSKMTFLQWFLSKTHLVMKDNLIIRESDLQLDMEYSVDTCDISGNKTKAVPLYEVYRNDIGDNPKIVPVRDASIGALIAIFKGSEVEPLVNYIRRDGTSCVMIMYGMEDWVINHLCAYLAHSDNFYLSEARTLFNALT